MNTVWWVERKGCKVLVAALTAEDALQASGMTGLAGATITPLGADVLGFGLIEPEPGKGRIIGERADLYYPDAEAIARCEFKEIPPPVAVQPTGKPTSPESIADEIMDTIERERRINRDDLIAAVIRATAERPTAVKVEIKPGEPVVANHDRHVSAIDAAIAEIVRKTGKVLLNDEAAYDAGLWQAAKAERLAWRQVSDEMVNPPAFVSAAKQFTLNDSWVHGVTFKNSHGFDVGSGDRAVLIKRDADGHWTKA